MSAGNATIRDVLYEPPGPRARRRIRIATALSLLALAALLGLIVRQFRITGQLDARYWGLFTRRTTWRFIGRGLLGTLRVALAASAVTFAAGMLLMLGRISRRRPLRWAAAALIEVSRGVPTLLFVYFFFLIAPQLGVSLPAFWKIALPVALSAAGVVAEVLRSGVNAVPRGQREAAAALGMRPGGAFRRIVFPQALRYVLPALIAELVIVLKDTTFAYVVNYADLMQNAKVLISNHDALLSVYLVVAGIYILINDLLNQLSTALARRAQASAAPGERRPAAWNTGSPTATRSSS